MLICIEGLTNSGKTTLCRKLVSELPLCYINTLMREDVVLDNISRITHPIENNGKFSITTELLLYSAILSQKTRQIENHSRNGEVLLVDRFSLSVYSQFCADPTLDCDFVHRLINTASNYIIPDLTFFLDVDLNTIIERSADSPFSRKDISLPERYESLREAYLSNISDFSEKYVVIECKHESTETISEVVKRQILDFIHPMIE